MKNEDETKRHQEILCSEYGAVMKMATLYGLEENDRNDVVQDTMIAAFNELDTLKDITRIRGWLFTIVKRKAMHCLRKNKLRRVRECYYSAEDWERAEIEELKVFSFREFSTSLDCEFSDEALLDMINQLSKPAPQIIKMRFGLGFKLTEIAVMLGINYNTVKSIETRALKNLEKKILKRRGDDESARTQRSIL